MTAGLDSAMRSCDGINTYAGKTPPDGFVRRGRHWFQKKEGAGVKGHGEYGKTRFWLGSGPKAIHHTKPESGLKVLARNQNATFGF